MHDFLAVSILSRNIHILFYFFRIKGSNDLTDLSCAWNGKPDFGYADCRVKVSICSFRASFYVVNAFFTFHFCIDFQHEFIISTLPFNPLR